MSAILRIAEAYLQIVSSASNFRYTVYMEQHAIPRQITSFEFKLIGFMTLKQFLYLVVFFPVAFIVYKLFPIPIINILLAVGVVVLGLVFAFLPVNDRPIDVWIKNFMKRLNKKLSRNSKLL